MSLTNDQITAKNFKDFYNQIRPYLNGEAHAGFTPVGTVISVMGKTAPQNYLVCDGTAYNIADYPELAAYFVEQFESVNFFGGDGTTTFAVPDLRGEFLRGTGTNSHANQGSGANVGVHQNGTSIPSVQGSGAISLGIATLSDADYYSPNIGRIYVTSTKTDEWGNTFTSRPTNTSVLYCIAVKNIFNDASEGQADVMPIASVNYKDRIVQYVGATNATYTNGFFYKCVTDGTTYEWAEVLINDNETQEISKADFDALPQSEKDNGKAYFIPDASVVSNFTVMGNRFDKANIYTEDERMVGSWMGKPLYQKTFEVTVPNGVNTEQDVTVDCTNLNIEQAVTAFLCHDGTDINTGAIGYFYPLPASASLMVWYNNSNKKIYVRRKAVSATAVGGGSTGFVTIQYTKTTDGEVKIGAPNDYSTDEMIIGTWIDGKPIYQKSVLCSIASEGDNSTPHDINNLESVIEIKAYSKESASNIWRAIPSAYYMITNNKAGWNVDIYITDLVIVIQPGSNFANKHLGSCYVTIQYTKTTD